MLTHVSISSFHGLDEFSASLSHRTHITGSNGSGKTHILDAIHLLSGGVSLYQHVRNEGRIEGLWLDENDLQTSYILSRQEDKDSFFVQNKRTTKPRYLDSVAWRSVSISPFDMNLLYFAPSLRRDYLDGILMRSYAQFAQVKRDYETTMRQRNALLKSIRENKARSQDLDFWDDAFARVANTYGIYRERIRDFIVESTGGIDPLYTSYVPRFVYTSSWIDQGDREAYIQSYLHENRERDILTGHTHIGPHRDDWGYMVHTRGSESDTTYRAEGFLSRGEMKMLLLGLKVLECRFLEKHSQKKIIFLIDDIFAELDDRHSEVFLDFLIPYQMILTSQRPLIDEEKYSDFACIKLENT